MSSSSRSSEKENSSAVLHYANKGHSQGSVNIERLTSESYDYFLTNFIKPNKPCIFAPNLTENWKSRRKWITSNSQPNFEYLRNTFGSCTVPVVICDDKGNSSCELRKEMLFKTYIEQYMHVNEEKTKPKDYLYLKDWHFNRAYPNYKAYITPKYFKEDWLNEFCENEKDDFKFVYIGPQGTWTPLHVDVFGSYSWSANVCGKKRWLLFPPGQEKLLQNTSNNLPYMLKANEISNYSHVSFLDIVQEPGEVIFVPSGWYHQVWNLENTISINHNWFNGYNILHIWKCLSNAALDVEHQLSDLKEYDDYWNEHESLLKAHHGMDLCEFFKILNFIFESRSKSLVSCKDMHESMQRDIKFIKNLCKEMLSVSLPKDLSKNVKTLFEKIINFHSEFKEINML